MSAQAPLLAQVRKITQHEGKDNSFETEKGDIKRIKYKNAEKAAELVSVKAGSKSRSEEICSKATSNCASFLFIVHDGLSTSAASLLAQIP